MENSCMKHVYLFIQGGNKKLKAFLNIDIRWIVGYYKTWENIE